ncbi:hypothetical protein BD626DRAFT_369257, partial [Schizophyllum amplum]
ARAFADATNQPFALYHALDTRGKGNNRQTLQGMAAEAAWRIPVKQADDLGGRVPYIPGMPVFGTENIATELGLSKGSLGTLVSVTYDERDGRRFAVSATVNFPAFQGDD